MFKKQQNGPWEKKIEVMLEMSAGIFSPPHHCFSIEEFLSCLFMPRKADAEAQGFQKKFGSPPSLILRPNPGAGTACFQGEVLFLVALIFPTHM